MMPRYPVDLRSRGRRRRRARP